jgi:2-oxoglutarate ferredoxin oxidoreductase subunit alpha
MLFLKGNVSLINFLVNPAYSGTNKQLSQFPKTHYSIIPIFQLGLSPKFLGGEVMSEKILMRGNEAVGEGAIRAGCRYFFGYPITPQNELFEYMAKRLPEVDGVFLQSESELSGINMILGAASGGARCMTSSSGPGFTLMGEGFTSLAAAQLPAVVVCVSRSGPGLGRIASSQSDYRLATRGGGHGDYHCLVLGPGSSQELYELTYLAFDLADHYRNPVIILSDAILGQMMEPVDIEKLQEVVAPHKEWAVWGKGDNPRKVIKVAPHTDEELIDWNRQLKKKYQWVMENEQRHEALYTDESSLVVVAFGSTSRIVLDALEKAREKGIPVGLFRPISLWPFPEKALKALLPGAKKFLVVESNNGQMVEDVQMAVCGSAEVSHYGVGGGYIFGPDELYNEIVKLDQK